MKALKTLGLLVTLAAVSIFTACSNDDLFSAGAEPEPTRTSRSSVYYTPVDYLLTYSGTGFTTTANKNPGVPFVDAATSVGNIEVAIGRDDDQKQYVRIGFFEMVGNKKVITDAKYYFVGNQNQNVSMTYAGYRFNFRIQGNTIMDDFHFVKVGGGDDKLTEAGYRWEYVETIIVRTLADVGFCVHISQKQGNTNDIIFTAAGKVSVATTIVEKKITIWSDGSETECGETKKTTTTAVENTTDIFSHTSQNNFWNNPQVINVGAFTIRFQPIGNTDVRVFEYIGLNDKANFDAISADFNGNIKQGRNKEVVECVTWRHHNGKEGNSVWNR